MIFSRTRVIGSLPIVGLSLALVVSACSSGSESLRFVPGGGFASETSSDAKMVWGNVSYVVEGTLGDMQIGRAHV